MTAEEFEREYAARSDISVEELRRTNAVLPCGCGEVGLCRGWAMVGNDPASIKAHNRLYGVKGEKP